MKKQTIAILFGGKSAEHEISLISAKNIINSIDKARYNTILIGIDKNGEWFLCDKNNYLINPNDPKKVKLIKSEVPLAIIVGKYDNQIIRLKDKKSIGKIDAVFPVLHGTFGEDGTVQGMLKLLNLPFVGVDMTGSAICMDKDITKRLLTEAKIPNSKFIVFKNYEKSKIKFSDIKKQLGMPLFVKPANAGSSVGISKVKNEIDFKNGINEAFKYDNKILIEEFISGREIECAVLGNDKPRASLIGEIISVDEFYSYKAKYIDEKGAILKAPTKLNKTTLKKVQSLAIQTYKTLVCEGMSRVDMFLTKNGKIVINEVNTIPGFTKISMYPKLWEQTGIPQKKLIDNLIQLAIERFENSKKIKTTFD
ncbi:MAG: D-alanine--D-alanine ligase [Patescibacteria group bacterium]|nr:D-alanine--D-alanine ligase [Patescibacteria group bacterium]MDD4304287.1 D-alanine--D-alanine ligase [Patescibacteria group bacterium]MDD4695686.1 D-alanine--D-alanine ligase [Patescibacteria group bacterium]